MELKWYALRVQNSREEKICLNLQKRVKSAGIDSLFGRILVPVETIQEIKGGKKRERKRVVYPGYLYLEIGTDVNLEADNHYKIAHDAFYVIRETPGIGDFISGRKKPIPMTDEDIRKVLVSSAPKSEEKVEVEFKRNDAVRIKDGPFNNFEGFVDEIDVEQNKVKVLVTIFGRETPVWLECWQVELE